MFDAFFNFFKKKKTTSLEDYRINQGYLKQRLEDAEKKGQDKAKEEIKEAIKEAKTGKKAKTGFEKFQDFADNFVKANQGTKRKSGFEQLQDIADNYNKQPSYFGGTNGKTKTSGKGSKPRSGYGLY